MNSKQFKKLFFLFYPHFNFLILSLNKFKSTTNTVEYIIILFFRKKEKKKKNC